MKNTGFISFVMCIALLVALVSPVFAEGSSEAGIDIEQALLSRGYPQFVLDAMNDAEKEQVYLQNETFGGGVICNYDADGNCTEIQIHEDGTYMMPRGQISTTELTLVLTYSVKKTNSVLDYIRVTLSYTWRELPVIRGEDALSVGWDEDLFEITENDFYKVDKYAGYYADLDGTPIYVNNQIQSEEYGYGNAGSSGVVWYADLKGNFGIIPTSLYGSGSFVLDARSTTSTGSSKLYANYFHNTGNVSASVNFGSLGTISVTGTGDERGINKNISW